MTNVDLSTMTIEERIALLSALQSDDTVKNALESEAKQHGASVITSKTEIKKQNDELAVLLNNPQIVALKASIEAEEKALADHIIWLRSHGFAVPRLRNEQDEADAKGADTVNAPEATTQGQDNGKGRKGKRA